MKFYCGPTYKEKIEAKESWHDWFAWFPVRLGSSHDCRWLETVERKGTFKGQFDVYWVFEYRAKENLHE